VEILIKAAVIGIIGALLALLLKRPNPELSLILTLGVGILVLGFAMELVSGIRELVDLAIRDTGLSRAVISPMLKCAGIGIITKLAADICDDADSKGIASSVELAGAAAALLVAMPLLKTLLQMIGELI